MAALSAYIDSASEKPGPLQGLEARVKVLGTLLIIMAAVLLPDGKLWPLFAYLGLLCTLLVISRLSLRKALLRAAIFGPFILTAVILIPFSGPGDGAVVAQLNFSGLPIRLYRSGLFAAASIFLKATISAFSVIICISTTRFPQIIDALQRFRVPGSILSVVSLLYRYLFLLSDELARMMRAARARGWDAAGPRRRLAAAGGILGSLFLRTYGRAERVYAAMLSRGYTDVPPRPERSRIKTADWVCLGGFGAYVGAIFFLAHVVA
jgi:cobalt/nickel transport system permease protein